MDFDHLAEERETKVYTVWLQTLLRNSPEQLAATLAAKHRGTTPTTASYCSNGAFNVCYRVRFEDGSYALVRFAALGRVKFRKEKVENEVAIMEYLAQNTSIPVPKVLGTGKCWAGPYIVMTFIEGKLLSGYLRDPLKSGRAVLGPKISNLHLKRAYREMAQIVLELSKPVFPRIGALTQDESKTWTVTKRPLTLNMNELAELANYPPQEFPTHSFGNAADYFEALATQQLCHLRTQRNDAATDEADCRKKYIARCLFRKIARDISTEYRNGPFRLFCDDFRPSNVLISDTNLTIAGVIDWEFAYVAPAEFTYTAPWWLLLQSPEDWESDLTEFLARYTPRLRVFLEALRECEAEKLKDGTLLDSQCLSERMAQSMENGLFWVCLVARYSSMFDEIYWSFIDRMYYGPFTSIEDRIGLLSEEEQSNLHEFVRVKMQQAGEGTLDIHQNVDEMVDL
jgi:aminoglycoside phosphotransferase (APT) family kinase protein